MSVVRSFIALDLPLQVKDVLSDIVCRISSQRDDLRCVKPANLHLTLRFLGDVDVDRLPGIGEAIRGVGRRCHPIKCALGPIGAFPKLTHARVLWVGLSGDLSGLNELHRAVETGVSGVGFAPERRPFKPHLTLARARREPVSLSDSTEPGPEASFCLTHLSLYQSDLCPGGARYTALETVRLGFER
jgi:RNA 2',3'-cyclic 3'-phosphodiesterase